MTTMDVQPIGTRISDEELEMMAPKILALATGEGRYNFGKIAEAAALERDELRYVMSTPYYQTLLAEQSLHMVSHTLLAGVRAMAEIIHSDKALDSNKVAAMRAVVGVLEAMRAKPKNPKKPTDEPSPKDFDQLVAALENARKPK